MHPKAGAATSNTIVNAWARHTAAEITATGRRAVESKDSAFYFTGAAPGGPAGWSRCWYDISTNVPATQMKLLLGGEMSMWSDSYVRSKSPLATENLLENTDGVLHQCSIGAAACYFSLMLTSALLMTSSHSEGTATSANAGRLTEDRRKATRFSRRSRTPRSRNPLAG